MSTALPLEVPAGEAKPAIRSVEIDGLRGIDHGKIAGLSPLSILVGPNNCGKSTVLEALLLGTNAVTEPERVLQTLLRRGEPQDIIAYDPRAIPTGAVEVATDAFAPIWSTAIRRFASVFNLIQAPIDLATMIDKPSGTTAKMAVGKNREVHVNTYAEGDACPVQARFVEAEPVRNAVSLEEIYSRLRFAGRSEALVKALAKSMPGLTGFEVLDSEGLALHTVCGSARPVPARVAGDGFKRFFVIAAALTEARVVLLEEPEAFQHPRYLAELATLLVHGAREGKQIVLTTHSIELIDLLLHHPDASPAFPTVHRLRLANGQLSAVTLPHERALHARDDLLEDLRR